MYWDQCALLTIEEKPHFNSDFAKTRFENLYSYASK